MAPARIHDSNEAGPATCAAPKAPRSQPEPMIEPRDTKVRPQKPTSRRRRPTDPGAPPTAAVPTMRTSSNPLLDGHAEPEANHQARSAWSTDVESTTWPRTTLPRGAVTACLHGITDTDRR